MSGWLAWHGQPVLVEELLFKSENGLVDQSRDSRVGAEKADGDGFGLGWYGTGEGPGRYRGVEPPRGDAKLRALAARIESPLFLAHVRAASGTAVQETNCHPFRSGKWLFVHNGFVKGFDAMRSDLMLSVDPDHAASIEGSTDSEVLFHLALTAGLERDPIVALERAFARTESVARAHGVDDAIQASIGVSDGERLWAVRYATKGEPGSLFVSGDAHALKVLNPQRNRLQRLDDNDCILASEPVARLPGAWRGLPESSALMIAPGGVREQRDFWPNLDARFATD